MSVGGHLSGRGRILWVYSSRAMKKNNERTKKTESYGGCLSIDSEVRTKIPLKVEKATRAKHRSVTPRQVSHSNESTGLVAHKPAMLLQSTKEQWKSF